MAENENLDYTPLSDSITKGFDLAMDDMLRAAVVGVVNEMIKKSGRPYSVETYGKVLSKIDVSKIGGLFDDKTLLYARELTKEIIGI